MNTYHIASAGSAGRPAAAARLSGPAGENPAVLAAPVPDDLPPRLRAVCDLQVSEAREAGGLHEYDGVIQDLSPEGVRAGLSRLEAARSAGGPLGDPHDEAQLAAFEAAARVALGQAELHRRNPLPHLQALDVAGYDKPYAPPEVLARARFAHLAAWPDGVDAAVRSLDQVPAPTARALAGSIRGLAAALTADVDEAVSAPAAAALSRLVAHVDAAARDGIPEAALGADCLAALMGSGEGMAVDLGRLAERADAERQRLAARLADSCRQLDPGRPPLDLVRDLVRDHPDAAGVLEAARSWAQRLITFTRDQDLMPYHDGECLVGAAPASRRMAMAMMTHAAPYEPDGPSFYHITPPDPAWPADQAEAWLQVFSATTLPGMTAHEVAPGHFSHGRARRRAPGAVRRVLHSAAFVEGWAHYAEELCVEEGFCAEDPRFAIGVWLQALVRVTRLACAIGVHTGGMTIAEAARRFEADTHLSGPAAQSEARRAAFDPTYGRYTWGKMEIMALRDRARASWGAGFSLRRFHVALMDLGAPPLGLLGTAIDRG